MFIVHDFNIPFVELVFGLPGLEGGGDVDEGDGDGGSAVPSLAPRQGAYALYRPIPETLCNVICGKTLHIINFWGTLDHSISNLQP